MGKVSKTNLKDSTRFLFYLENGTHLRELSLSSSRLVQIGFLALLVVSLSVFGLAQYLSGLYYEEKIKAITADNADLNGVLDDLRSKISGLENQVDILSEKDKVLRLYADLPEIDQDIRKMGVGGYVEPLGKVENLDPETQTFLNNIKTDITKLAQSVKLELQSYEELYESLQTQKERIESTPSIPPTLGGYVSSPFGYRIDPFTKKRKMHHGLDISAPTGTPIYATASGTVVYAKWYGGYGYTIKLDHGYGYSTIYAHLSKMNVRKGQQVNRGEAIGKMGNTGKSTGPHLHYEVRYHNQPMNPVEFIWTDEKL